MEYFTDFSIAGDSICVGGIGAFCMVGSSLTLDHQKRTAENIVMTDSSHVSTLNPLYAHSIRFAYRFDDEEAWRQLEPGNNHIDYSGLGSGTYTLEVMATDEFGRWGEPQKVHTFTRGNTWLWLALFLTLAGAGCGFWYWRRKKSLSPALAATTEQGEETPGEEPETRHEPQAPPAGPRPLLR